MWKLRIRQGRRDKRIVRIYPAQYFRNEHNFPKVVRGWYYATSIEILNVGILCRRSSSAIRARIQTSSANWQATSKARAMTFGGILPTCSGGDDWVSMIPQAIAASQYRHSCTHAKFHRVRHGSGRNIHRRYLFARKSSPSCLCNGPCPFL